ncbi:MAG: GNAT family N-acetyltransferase [Phycisphaerales bacterium]|nr:GNAT family N-acetyltransferase [Phycisphaerales bacterium]
MAAPDTHQHRVTVRLRPVQPADLPTLCAFQQDPDSCALAAVKPRTTDNFLEHWRGVLADDTIIPRAILADETLAGTISRFNREGEHFVGYWIAREHWGKGIATRALQLLLEEVTTRPLRASVASHNAASLRVLERCGFAITGKRHEPATDRFLEADVVSLILRAPNATAQPAQRPPSPL